MIIQKRSESLTLQIQESLNNRMKLSPEHKQKYIQNQKGYEGEQTFDWYVEKAKLNCVILNDIRLKVDGNKVQIDSLFISENKVYLFEVKNYKGEFHYREGGLYLNSEKEIFNPLNQITRSKIILNNLLRSLQEGFSVEAVVIFINPDFFLYQAPVEKQFIYSNQLEKHLEKVKRASSMCTERSYRLAEKILHLQCEEEIFTDDLPIYDECTLKKGITCKNCHSFNHTSSRQNLFCKDCAYTEPINQAIDRSIREYQLLFPNKKITRRAIHQWCGETYPEQRIKRQLRKNFILKGGGRSSYYELTSN